MKRMQIAVRVSQPAFEKLGVLRRRLGISACRAVECAIMDFDIANRAGKVASELNHETDLPKAA
jgi:hypothetical protein